MAKQLTAEEAERLRELLATHDSETNDEVEFDPSKVRVPYVFKKFPMVVYDHARSFPAHDEEKTVIRGSVPVMELVHVKAHLVQRTVSSQHELDAALAAGWSQNPPEFRDEVESEPTEAEQEPVTRRRRA